MQQIGPVLIALVILKVEYLIKLNKLTINFNLTKHVTLMFKINKSKQNCSITLHTQTHGSFFFKHFSNNYFILYPIKKRKKGKKRRILK